MADGWTTTASETRFCLPYRSIEDLNSQPRMVWSWRDGDERGWRELDEPRLVPPGPFESSIHVEGRLELSDEVSAAIVDRLGGTPLLLGLVAQSSSSRNRGVDWGLFEDGTRIELEIRPGEWRGVVEFSGVAVTDGLPPTPSLELPSRRGSRVWSSSVMHVVLDEGSPNTKGGFDVQWAELDGEMLYRLETKADDGLLRPLLKINNRDSRLSRVWTSTANTGRDARLRDLLNATVALEVLTELAVLADGIDPEADHEQNVEFRREVHRTLERRFKLRREEFTGLYQEGARQALAERLQQSLEVALLSKVGKVLDEVGR